MPGADVRHRLDHPAADGRKLQAASGEGMAEADRAAADRPLVAHQFRDRQRQERQQVGDAGKRMHQVESARAYLAQQRGGVAQGVGARATGAAGPGDQLSRCGRIRMSKQGHLVAPAAQFTGEQIDDALYAAVELRRNWKFGIGGEGDAHNKYKY